MKLIQEKCNEQDEAINKFVNDHNETVNLFIQYFQLSNNLKKSAIQATKDDDDDYDIIDDSNHLHTKFPKTGHEKQLKIPPSNQVTKDGNEMQQPTTHRYFPANSKYAPFDGDANKGFFKSPNNSTLKSHAGQRTYAPPPNFVASSSAYVPSHNYTDQTSYDYPPGFSKPYSPPQNYMGHVSKVYQPNSGARSLAYAPPGFSDKSALNETPQKSNSKSATKKATVYNSPSSSSPYKPAAAYNQVPRSNLSAAYKPVSLPSSPSPQSLPEADDDETFTNCYIKNLPAYYDDENLRQLFAQFGTSVAIKVAQDNNGMSLNFGYCSMSTHQEALNAIKNLNGIEIDGNQIICCRHLSKQKRSKEIDENSEKWRQSNFEKYKGRNLYVRDIDTSVTNDDLMEAFSHFGEIESAEVMRDSMGKSKKCAYICFKKVEDAQQCLMFQSSIKIHDRTPTVVLSTSPEERQKNFDAF